MRNSFPTLGVFCGSRSGSSDVFAVSAVDVGRYLAKNGIEIIYGGGRVGLMGHLADGALSEGGRVVGVMPRKLVDLELAHPHISSLIVVETMHERKEYISSRSLGFIALPGATGTIEEVFEQWAWSQLGIHQKPCALLNVAGYYDYLIKMVGRMVEDGFLERRYAEMLIEAVDINDIAEKFSKYVSPSSKWIS